MTLRLSPGPSHCLVAPFVCCQDQRGAEVRLGGARVTLPWCHPCRGPPTYPTHPRCQGWGAERAQGCCRKLLLRGFRCNWGETQRFQHLLLGSRWGARPLGAARGGCGPGPAHPVTQVSLCKGGRGEQCLQRSHGPSWAQPPGHCPVGPPVPHGGRGAAGTDLGSGSSSLELPRVRVLGRVCFGGKGRAPFSRARVLQEAVSTRRGLHLGVLLAPWVLRGEG